MKRFLSVILALSMLLAPMTAFADVVTTPSANKEVTNPIADGLLAESATLDTSVFEGAPGYILQDAFSAVSNVEQFGMPSGWDVDKRGGRIVGWENAKCQIIDISNNNLVSMSRQLLPHKAGKITFETAFMMENKAETGYSYTLFGEDKTIFKIMTESDKIAVQLPDGKTKQVSSYLPNQIVRIKASIDIDAKTYDLIVDGKNVGKFKFVEEATQVDKILISTSDEQKMTIWLRYVYLYFNYIVNETFMQTPEGGVPYDWERVAGGNTATVVFDQNQVYPDTYSYAISDPTTVDNVDLKKTFDDAKGKVVFHTRFIAEQKGDAVISVGNGNQKAISVKLNTKDMVMGNGTVLRADYLANLWYTLKIVLDTDTKKADVYLNYQKVLSDVPFENAVSALNTISYETEIRKVMNMRIDDVQVYYDITPSDYVPAPEVVKPEGDLEIGMQMYSMWHDNHFGWDWITAYPDRIPYLGLYSEGKPEVADWVTKWQVEHGLTFRTEIFSRAENNINQPVKLPTRYNALYDGYLNSKYKDDIKFAILYSGEHAKTHGGMDDFKNNIVPHLIENLFKQPNYLLKDNKPVMFSYATQKLADLLGGMDKANEAVAYLDEECKKAGFDGVIWVPDGTSGEFINKAPDFGKGYVYSYTWRYDSRSTKTQLAMNDFYMATGAKTVANVTMGWGRNPWSKQDQGEIFSTPQVTKETILGLKERFKAQENPTNMIMLTCWDEYGEGHFFAPTRVHGFEYLNAVRDAVTSLGPKQTEVLPTAKAMARMDSLNLGSRRALKMVTENPAPVYVEDQVDRSKLQLLAEWDFSKMTDVGGWKEFQQATNIRIEDGAIRGEATGVDPGIWLEGLNIKASDVQMLKIETQTEGSGQGRFFYQTDIDPEMGTKGKRFDFQQDSSDWKEYEAFPFTRDTLKGNITAIRWDPKDNGYPTNTKFAVRKIQLWGYPTEETVIPPTPMGLLYNGDVLSNTQPPFVKDGVTYFAIHRALYEMGLFKTKYDHKAGTYTIEYDKDSTAVITVGSNIMKVNGQDVDLGAPCYYENGNLFVPLRTTMEALGAEIGWDSDAGAVTIKIVDKSDLYNYQETTDKSKPFSWMFETRGTEGFTGYMYFSTFKSYQGALWFGASGDDTSFKSGTFSMPADEYKYIKLRIKNEGPQTDLMLFFARTDTSSWGGGRKYSIRVSGGDSEYKEYIIDLSSCPEWKGTITQFRIDPYATYSEGDMYFDSIEVLKELPQ